MWVFPMGFLIDTYYHLWENSFKIWHLIKIKPVSMNKEKWLCDSLEQAAKCLCIVSVSPCLVKGTTGNKKNDLTTLIVSYIGATYCHDSGYVVCHMTCHCSRMLRWYVFKDLYKKVISQPFCSPHLVTFLTFFLTVNLAYWSIENFQFAGKWIQRFKEFQPQRQFSSTQTNHAATLVL